MSNWQVRNALAYLTAKETVDRRSLNQAVRERLLAELAGSSENAAGDRQTESVRVLELGAGRGWMGLGVAQALEAPVDLVINELDPDVLAAARENAAKTLGLDLTADRDEPLVRVRDGQQDTVSVLPGDFMAPRFATGLEPFDLVVAHSVADLMDVRDLLTRVASLLRPGGLFYAPVTVDGGTTFSPEYTPAGVERELVEVYERIIDRKVGADANPSAGGSRAGSALSQAVKDHAGWEWLADGPSDWQVSGADDGGQDFLAHLLHFFEDSLTGRPEISPLQLLPWLARRQSDLAAGRLAFTVRNRDILARRTS